MESRVLVRFIFKCVRTVTYVIYISAFYIVVYYKA